MTHYISPKNNQLFSIVAYVQNNHNFS